MADLSGADNDGISAGGVLFNQSIAGPVGRHGAEFDGSSGFVQVESRSEIVDLSASPAFTIELQLMPAPLVGLQWIMAKGVVGALPPEVQFEVLIADGAGRVRFRFGDQDVTSTGMIISNTTLTHLVVVWDGVGRNLTFHFNGVADLPILAAAPVYLTFPRGNPVLIGGADSGGHFGLPTKFFKGTIRKVALYSTALSPERIKSHFGAM